MHIDNDDLIKFENGTMEEDELIEFLSHLDRCDFCLEQMMTQESNTPVASAPAYLADQILGKADSGEVQFAKAANKASHKVQLLYYGLQTAAGIAVALFLLFSVPEIDFSFKAPSYSVQTNRSSPDSESGRLYNFTRDIGQSICDETGSLAQYLNDFSSKIMNGGK